MKQKDLRKRVPLLGIFAALALILSFIESMIPFYFGIPGMKLGLCNVLIVLLLYYFPAKDALTVNIIRILLAGFMFGNGFSIIYSLAGGILSFLVMYAVYRTGRFTVMTVSITGGMSHNIGQLFVASVVMTSINIFWYAPALLLFGAVTGAINGIIATEVMIRYDRHIFDPPVM